jgi:Membrane transporters of cations and cationic drugs
VTHAAFTYAISLLLVLLAAVLDVTSNMLLVKSNSFQRRGLGALALALVGLAFYCLSLAVRHMDLAVAYAMWGGFGVLGTSLCGWLLLRQRLKPSAFAGIALLACGMVLLHTS